MLSRMQFFGIQKLLARYIFRQGFASIYGNQPRKFYVIYLLSYYLANKRSLHVHSHSLEIHTLIGEKIIHHCHYDKKLV